MRIINRNTSTSVSVNSGADPNRVAVAACIAAGILGFVLMDTYVILAITIWYVSFVALLLWYPTNDEKRNRFTKIGFALLKLSVFVGFLTIWSRPIPFNVMEWIVTILYISALGFGVLRSLSKLLQIISVFLALVTVTAIVVLPVPKGREDTSDKDNNWSVAVTVNDQDGHPVANALVVCTVLIAGGKQYA